MPKAKKDVKEPKPEVEEVQPEPEQQTGEFTEEELRDLNHHSFWRKLWRGIKILFWMAVVAAGVWYYQQMKIDTLSNEKAELTQEVKDAKAAQKKAESQLADANSQIESGTNDDSVPPLVKQTIVAAVTSGNFAGLNTYMADKVSYAIAASEAQGTLTKTQAINQLGYLSSGTSPWNFNLGVSTIAKYKAGNYKAYIGDDVIFGSAANKYFVSFHLDSANKIDQFFLSASTDLL